MNGDAWYMNRCETLAEKAAQRGEAPVGALIVKDGQLISEAMEAVKTTHDITCHAEIDAIRLAVKKLNTKNLSGCTMYTTHEPCVMCSYAIRFHRITKIVYQYKVDFLGGISSSLPLLTTDDVPPTWGKAPEIVQLMPQQ